MKVATVAEMRNLDRRATAEYGIPDHLLMENAGEAVYYAILQEFGVLDRSFAVVCGLGNNGGDGFVVARKIHSSGGEARVFVLGDPEAYGETARLHLEMLSSCGAQVAIKPELSEIEEGLEECDAIIDGLFGTGIKHRHQARRRGAVPGDHRDDQPVGEDRLQHRHPIRCRWR